MVSDRATTDFFENQDQARRKTVRLVLLFGLAVVLLSLGTYIALAFLLNPEAVAWATEPEIDFFFDLPLYGVAVVVTGAFIAIGSLWKTSALKQGGSTVAEELGGREVDSSTGDPLIRRYVNVVEEMSLASGVPVPRIYVLENEPGINAFAAGFSMNDAAVAVTRGALEQLDRDELQGVIAHEFSHILNGDMRLNIRLIGVIHGIVLMFMTGRILLYSMGRGRRRSSRGKGAAAILAAGLVMMIFGFAGIVCGRLIKSAVSRQREYLADSAAVQFTRNPKGLAGALKKIGGFTHGSKLQASNAEEVSHMCFGDVAAQGMVSKLTGSLMSTHPPIKERIKAIDPAFEAEQEFKKLDAETQRADLDSEASAASSGSRRGESTGAAAAAAASGLAGGGGGTAVAGSRSKTGAGKRSSARTENYEVEADEVVNQVGRTSPERLVYCSTLLEEIPRPLMEARSDLMGAMATVYTLLLDEDDRERQKQGRMLQDHADPKVVRETQNLWPAVATLDQEFRLPLMDLLVPTLRRMTEDQYREFAEMVERLIQADDEVSFKEFVLEKVVLHRLEIALHDADRSSVEFRSFSEVVGDIENLLSSLVFIGHDEPRIAEKAFDDGCARLPRSICDDVGFKPPADWTFKEVGDSLDRLSVASPTIKKAVVDACAYCVMGDDEVTVEESEMLRAICEVLDVPLPPFIPEATSRT